VRSADIATRFDSRARRFNQGDRCNPVGATFTQGGVTFTCTKIGAQGVWKSRAKKDSKSPVSEYLIMPNLVGMNLQFAQDLLQSKGSYLIDQEDFKGLGRFQLIDSNWKVCSQSPSAGKRVLASSVVTLSSVKLSEKC
jgi:PASTA domain